MISRLSDYMVVFLCKNKIIEESESEVYVYGMQIIFSDIICIMITCAIGIIFSHFVECLCFMIVFVLIRSYCGGYHAKTHFNCNCLYTFNLALVVFTVDFFGKVNLQFHGIVTGVSLISILFLAPIENSFKPLSIKAKKAHNIKALLLSLVLFSSSILLIKIYPKLFFVIDMTILSVVVSMYIQRIINLKGGINHEKNHIKDDC